MKKTISFFIMLLAMMLPLVAQNVNVTGTVYDEESEPMPGVTVVIEGTNQGTSTSADGTFHINVPKNAVLTFMMLGYQTKSVGARNGGKINVSMEPERQRLDEAVVIGYGTMKRSDLTGSVVSVSARDIQNQKTSNALEALSGMVSGVNITTVDGAPGPEMRVQVRGVGTVNGDSSPIYVVDGFEVANLNHIANADISSIEILKDASATAIYGSRGANGVVLVTTKSGRVGRPEITYNGSATYKSLARKIDVLSPYEFVALQMEVNPVKFANYYYREGVDENDQPYKYQTLEDYRGVQGVDWQAEAFRPTWSQSHDVSLRGGSKDTQYSVSYSHFDDQGIFKSNTYAKNSARIKFQQKVTDWLSFIANVSYTNLRNTGVGTGGSTLSNILQYRPTGGLYISDEFLRTNSYDPVLDDFQASNTSSYNPIINAENTDVTKRNDVWDANGSLNFRLSKHLQLKVSGYYSNNFYRYDTFYRNGSSLADRGSGPYGSSSTRRTMKYSNTNQLSYIQTFNKVHKLNLMLGQETTYQMVEEVLAEAKNFPLDNLGVDNLGLGAVSSRTNSSKTDNRRLSFFTRAFYSYADRYMLTATLRADASSVFADKHKWGFFPSFSLAWNISNEKFMKNVDWLSSLKLRAGWGMVGNDRISSYLSLDLYDASLYGVGSHQEIALQPSHLANPELRWEASATANVGIDASFFKERLSVTVDGFIKNSKDLLLLQDLALASGFAQQWQNVGQIRNTGIELSVKSVNFDRRNFSWTTDFNISFIKNSLISLNSGKDYLLSRSGIHSNFSSYDYIAKVGDPIGSMYGYVFDGVYQQSDFEVWGDGTLHLKKGVVDISEHAGKAVYPGFVKYKDLDGDGIITTEDRTTIGNGQPDFYGGLTNTFHFYGVDFSFMLQFVYGNEVYNAQRMYSTQTQLQMMNFLGEVRDRWTPTHASNTVPEANGYVPYDVYSRFIEDGSFLRLKNVTLGYTLPAKFTQRFSVSTLRFYVSAQNLFCLTSYSGSDPEVSMRSSALMPSFDYGAYPKSRAYTAGVQITF